MRVFVIISYNGVKFFGSQVQKEIPNTVFGEVEKVLNHLGIDSKPQPSGRTDRGVHATGQVFHIDLPPFWKDTKKLKKVLNEMLPTSIHVKKILHVEDTLHARYSAKTRVYRYLIKTSKPNPFEDDFITFLQSANLEQIQQNIKLFEGKHNFKYFMKTGSQTKSTTRTIYKAFAYKHKETIVLNFEADGFLRTQVRFMVGAVLNLTQQQIKEKLSLQKNHKLKPAPSNGLYLAKVRY